MKPTKFEQSNRTLLRPSNMTDDECSSLDVYTDDNQCISCWRLSWRERLSALLFGKVWVYVLSGNTQPPIVLVCERDIFKELSKISGGGN